MVRPLLLIALVSLLAASWATPAEAGRCTTNASLERAGATIAREIHCAGQAVLKGEEAGACQAATVPACAQEALAQALEIVFGPGALPNGSGWPRAARFCQHTLVRESVRFFSGRTRERLKGRRGTRSGRGFRRVVDACDNLSIAAENNFTTPTRLAGVCLQTQGEQTDGPATAGCIRGSLEAIIDDLAPEPLAPNVILIITDDQRQDSLQFLPITLQSIAARGVSFSNAFSTHPICGPARATLLSGLDTRRHRVFGNGNGANFDESETLATWLSAAGYRTGLFGKYLHAASSRPEPPPGWDVWRELNDLGAFYFGFSLNVDGETYIYDDTAYSTDVLAAQLTRFVRRNRQAKFFAVYSPTAGHAPFTPANRHIGAFAGLAPWRPTNFRETDTSGKPGWVRLLQAGGPESTDHLDQIRRDQLGSLLPVDDAVRRIDRTLERLGLFDNTVVIFTSDQGYHWGEHWSNTKFSAYEESIRIPLLMRYPRRWAKAREEESLVANTDLAPTIAALAGVPYPADLDGSSLLGLLAGTGVPRSEVFIESSGGWITAPSRSIRTPRWKLIRSSRRISALEFTELYDLENDPGELLNLSGLPGYETIELELENALNETLPRLSRNTTPRDWR
ncbi:MAG: sulfatase [Deltaproteobacteria bacterium]